MTFAATAAWLRPRLWFGAVVGVVPWLTWLGSLAIGGWYKDFEGTLFGADHLAFYTAAHLIRDGQSGRLYDYLDLSRTNYQAHLIGWDWPGFEAYRNPPFYALLYYPTAGLSYYASVLIWTAIGFALLAFSIWLLHPKRPGQAFLWSLTFYPVFATVSFGQNTFLSLTIFAGVYRLLETNRRFAAGLVAGLLWFKPQLLLGLFVWWVLCPRRCFRCWLGVGVMGLALAAISWIVLPQASQAFVDTLRTNVGYSGFGLWNVHNPKGFFQMLIPESVLMPEPDSSQNDGKRGWGWSATFWSLTLVVSAFSVAIAWRIARRSGAPVAVMFPVAVFLSLWASPHALIYEWAILIAAGVVVWEQFPERRDAWLCLFALAWSALAISTTFAWLQKQHLPIAVQVSIPVLGLVGWLAARELAIGRAAVSNR